MNDSHADLFIPRQVRRLCYWFFFWLVICWAIAAPSFAGAALSVYQDHGYNGLSAATLGVMCYVVLYTCLSFTPAVQKIESLPVLRKTLRIAFAVRFLQSFSGICIYYAPVYIPVQWLLIALIPDAICGEAALSIGKLANGGDQGFRFILMTTLIDGLLLHLVMAGTMLVIYPLVRRFSKQVDPTKICIKCSYDLRASTGSCPECGQPIPSPSASV